jgi:hypothetical protein
MRAEHSSLFSHCGSRTRHGRRIRFLSDAALASHPSSLRRTPRLIAGGNQRNTVMKRFKSVRQHLVPIILAWAALLVQDCLHGQVTVQRIKSFGFPGQSGTISHAPLIIGAAQSPAGGLAKSEPIPPGRIGAVAGKQYQGEGLSVAATPEGARLRCDLQKLEGQVTRQGLRLTSTTNASKGERFYVIASTVTRESGKRTAEVEREPLCPLLAPSLHMRIRMSALQGVVGEAKPLPRTGTVEVVDQVARFIRPGMTEEYTVSVDGVRQDFILDRRPGGTGPLRVELDLAGARAEPLVNSARLVLDGSGRRIAYGRLRATDAQGNELTAAMAVLADSRLVVVVDDADATYPLRIDPTFSDANWISMGTVTGADGFVTAAVVDGAGNLYIGGDFTVVGDVIANHVAKWDGSAWSALDSGMDGSVEALAVSGTNLYAGGLFWTAGGSAAKYIAKWNGSRWSALGSGMDGSFNPWVRALAVSGTNLYAGGGFTTAGGNAANHIAKWNGSAWSALGWGLGGEAHAYVCALAVSDTNLYAGGSFSTADGSAGNYIAKWDGSSWSALGSGMGIGPAGGNYPYVNALAVSGTNLYAGGDFTYAGGSVARYVAKWDGSAWSALGSGVNSTVYALLVSGTNLYAGGSLWGADGTLDEYIAKWNGSEWSALGPGMNGQVSALALSGTNLYAGGGFTRAGGSGSSCIAKWNGSVWSALAAGVNDSVLALAVSGNDLYAGGSFTTAGGSAANYIAKWGGSSWSALGSGMGGDEWPYVLVLAVSGANLYAGGWFKTAGGSAANYIAKWDGSAWSALGGGLNSSVYGLAVSGTNLYAGGDFTYATNAGPSAVQVNHIAKWDGSAWSALGSGMGGGTYPCVNALAVSGNDLYAGGSFTTAGGSAAIYIAKWDGSAWSALGLGMAGSYNSSVLALAVSGTNLYAGGDFTYATNTGPSAVNVNYVAKWNGSAWSALGTGMNDSVAALAVSGTNLFVGGRFTYAGGSAASYMAKWDGSVWSVLGSGMGGTYPYVSALAVSGPDLYAAGSFTTAGGKVSGYVARAIIGTAGGRFSSLAYSRATGFNCNFSEATAGEPYRIQASLSLPSPGWTDLTNFTYTGPIIISDLSATATTNRFYRAVTP